MRIHSTIAALMIVATQAQAQEMVFTRNSLTVNVNLEVTEPVEPDYAVTLTPCVVSDGDTLAMEPVTFRAKRNKKYTERARFFDKNNRRGTAATHAEHEVGETVHFTRTLSRNNYPALWSANNVHLVLKREKEGCCNVVDLPPTVFENKQQWVAPISTPVFSPKELSKGKAGELAKKYPVLRHISEYDPNPREGALYVNFPLDKWELLHDFRTNGERLDLIEEVTRAILADTTSTVKLIQIVGMASIEGPVKRNEMLGQKRAEVLKQYVIDHVAGVTDSLFEITNRGEGWIEFEECVNERTFEGKQQVLDIIHSEPDINRREKKLKQLNGGRTYKYLLENVLIDQRFSGYVRIYYDYVRDTAGETINNAIQLMTQAKYTEALPLLQRYAYDHRSWNAMGLCLYYTGHRDEAINYLRRAAANNDADALNNLQQLEIEK